jgi:preprotein translocase subunit SecF
MRFRRVSYPFSAFHVDRVGGCCSSFIGMNFGIDFAGGTLIELRAKPGQADVAQLLRNLGEHLQHRR